MGSEGSIGSIRSAGSGQSTEGTNGQSTSILIENARVGISPRSPHAAPLGLPALAWAGDGAPVPSLLPPAPPSKGGAAGTEHPPPNTYMLPGLSREMLLGGPQLPPIAQLAFSTGAVGSGWYHTASPPCPVPCERTKRALGQILPRSLAKGQPFTG